MADCVLHPKRLCTAMRRPVHNLMEINAAGAFDDHDPKISGVTGGDLDFSF